MAPSKSAAFWGAPLCACLLFFAFLLPPRFLPAALVPKPLAIAVGILLALVVAAYFLVKNGKAALVVGGALCIAFIVIAMQEVYFPTALLSLLFLCVPFYLLQMQGRTLGAAAEELGLTRKRLLANLLLVVPLLLVVLGALLVLTRIYAALGVLDTEKVAGAITGVPEFILLLAIIINPVTEEIFFRGFLTPRFGIWASAALFAASHAAYGSIAEVGNVLVIGTIFSFVFLRTRSLAAPIAAHILINSAAIYAIRYAGL